ncbi:hypothetical protein CRG98_001127 [Punica granatum]|uniref:Uncharacterized protein n=1 Tax=Punica granatum TaxID=22663 RepID=A0A2I0LCT3_PUNGR|nr:hypothetical protein CRG98_001127 [Punica granatum]
MVNAAGGLPAKVDTTRISCGWVVGMDGLWSRHVSPWRGEDCGWSAHESWHDSLVVQSGSCFANINIKIDRMHAMHEFSKVNAVASI